MQRLLLCGFNIQDIKREMVRTWQTFMSAVERLTCQQTLELLFLNSLYVKFTKMLLYFLINSFHDPLQKHHLKTVSFVYFNGLLKSIFLLCQGNIFN